MGNWPKYRKRLSATGEKVRNVLVLIYMEDLEKAGTDYFGLLRYIASLHIEACVSPVHDRDTFTSEDVRSWCEQHIDPDTGDLDMNYVDSAPYVGKPKKPHCHVLMKIHGQQNAYWWSDLMSGLLDIRPTMWEKCLSISGSMRYWAHMDDPDKAQYSPYDIVGFGGIDLSPLTKVDDRTKTELVGVIYDMVNQHGCRYFYQLMDLAQEAGDSELVSYLRGSYSLWQTYLGSKAQKMRDDAYYKKLRDDAKKSNNCTENVGNSVEK